MVCASSQPASCVRLQEIQNNFYLPVDFNSLQNHKTNIQAAKGVSVC